MKGKTGRRRESNLKDESSDTSVGEILSFCSHLIDGRKRNMRKSGFGARN